MAAAPRTSMEPALSPVAVAKALLPLTAAPTAQGDGLPGGDWMPSRVAFEAPAPPPSAPPPSAPPPPSAVWAQQAHHQQQAQQARQAQQQAQQLQQAQQAQQQWQQQAQQAQQQQLALESPLKQQQRLAVESEAARKRSCATASAGRHPATASPGRQPAIAASCAIDELNWCAPHHRLRRRCTTRFTTGATSVQQDRRTRMRHRLHRPGCNAMLHDCHVCTTRLDFSDAEVARFRRPPPRPLISDGATHP